MTRKKDARVVRAMPREAVLAMPIIDLDLPRTVKERLSVHLSEESELEFFPEEVTLSYLIQSKYDLEKIPAMNVVRRQKMFCPSVCEKIKTTLRERYNIDYAEERLQARHEQILKRPIVKAKLPSTIAKRLTEFLSEASYGKIKSEEATITDLLHSAYDVCEMTAYYEDFKRKMFTPLVAQRIVAKLEEEYGIDYAKEREIFLAQHTGLDSFIVRTGLPNNCHIILLSRMQNFNATFRDLLDVPFDFRLMKRFSGTTNSFILGLFEAEGIDYESARRK